LGFLPARQLLDIRHPTFEVGMIVERQALGFVHVHRRRDRNVGDRHGVTGEPFGLRQARVEYASKPVPVGRFLFDDGFVRPGIQQRLDDVFDEISIATREPSRPTIASD